MLLEDDDSSGLPKHYPFHYRVGSVFYSYEPEHALLLMLILFSLRGGWRVSSVKPLTR